MSYAIKMGGGGYADKGSTLPPPISNLYLNVPESIDGVANTDGKLLVTFDLVKDEFAQYLGDPAYIVVVKEGSVPQSPDDGIVVKLAADGSVIGSQVQ